MKNALCDGLTLYLPQSYNIAVYMFVHSAVNDKHTAYIIVYEREPPPLYICGVV